MSGFKYVMARLRLPMGYSIEIVRPATQREITKALLDFATREEMKW